MDDSQITTLEQIQEILFHRSCGFATVTVDEKGRRRRKYETYQTPYERLKSIAEAEKYLRPGLSFEILDRIRWEILGQRGRYGHAEGQGQSFQEGSARVDPREDSHLSTLHILFTERKKNQKRKTTAYEFFLDSSQALMEQ